MLESRMVLKQAIVNHGKPSSIFFERGSQFYANESKGKRRNSSKFEIDLAALDIRQILCGMGHPQTNDNLERFHGEVQRWLPTFVEKSADRITGRGDPGGHVDDIFYTTRRRDPMTRLIDWYNMLAPTDHWI